MTTNATFRSGKTAPITTKRARANRKVLRPTNYGALPTTSPHPGRPQKGERFSVCHA